MAEDQDREPTDAELDQQREAALDRIRPNLGPLGNYLRDKEPWLCH